MTVLRTRFWLRDIYHGRVFKRYLRDSRGPDASKVKVGRVNLMIMILTLSLFWGFGHERVIHRERRGRLEMKKGGMIFYPG